MVVTYFKVLCRHEHGETEENHGKVSHVTQRMKPG